MAGSISCRCSQQTANIMISEHDMQSAPPHIRSVFRGTMPSAAAPTHAPPQHYSRRPEPCTSVYIRNRSKHKKNGGCSSSKADHTVDDVKMKVADPSWAPSHQSEFPTCRKRDAAVSGQDHPQKFGCPISLGSINSII